LRAAERIGLWPDLPSEATAEIYDTAGGPAKVYRVEKAVKVEVVGREQKILADAVISQIEVLISDKLADELMIAIERPGDGVWRFRDEKTERRSEKPEIWL